MNNPVKYFLLHPPIWAEKILSKSARYRAFVIKECVKVLNRELRELQWVAERLNTIKKPHNGRCVSSK